MGIKYLGSKKGSPSDTLIWMFATIIIVVMLIIYLFAVSLAKPKLNSDIQHRKFLSNSFEREFYTFLDEPVLFDGKNISVKELSKKVSFIDDARLLLEERLLRNETFKFVKMRGDLIDVEKTKTTDKIVVKVESHYPRLTDLPLVPQHLLNELSVDGEFPYSYERGYFYLITPEILRDPALRLPLRSIDRSGIECSLKIKGVLFMEAFISKDKKITYCFNY